ncbi:MAG: hypothetical protein ACREOM_03910, partial [Candidatus Dormibacteraceae bacterium]
PASTTRAAGISHNFWKELKGDCRMDPGVQVGIVLDESLHATAVPRLGSHPALVLRRWPLALAPLTVTGIHVQPVQALDPVCQALTT